MSILGYSTAYFLPQYWVNTPLYGEKLIPLLDYILSTDYVNADKLALAFYDIESKYKNTADLPVDKIEAIIEESGYGYVRELLGTDEESLKLLVYLLVMIHQLKGSGKGIEFVLSMLRISTRTNDYSIEGNLYIDNSNEASGFSQYNYIYKTGFIATGLPFQMNFQIKTGNNFNTEQCIASSPNYGFYLGINTSGELVLSLGQQVDGVRGWQVFDGDKTRLVSSKVLSRNTNYYITLFYTGYSYELKVSTDGDNYVYYITSDSGTSLDINGGVLYIGIDKSTSLTRFPFNGVISLDAFNVFSSSVKVTSWSELFPVGEEDTFTIDSELDATLISIDFFKKFANFAEKYVYPSLKAFRARLQLISKVVFIPYVREKVTYVISNIVSGAENFMVVDEENEETHIPYEVEGAQSTHEDFLVQS